MPSNRNWFSRIALSCALWVLTCNTALALQNFTVDFSSEQQAEKIGDLRPRVLPLDKKPVPDVSIKYVMSRYRSLFDNANSPHVRIEALDRMNNLSASYGIYEEKLMIDKYVQAEAVLEIYDQIVETGEQYERMDYLLYQTAKAAEFSGDLADSVKRLELLVGLYPRSPLVQEAMFRLAESYFELSDYRKAKEYYESLWKKARTPKVKAYSQYKLAWTNYRLNSTRHSMNALARFFEEFPDVYNLRFDTDLSTIAINSSPHEDFGLVVDKSLLADGMRLLAVLNNKGDRLANIRKAAKHLGGPHLEPVVLKAMIEQLSSKKRYFDSARLITAFVSEAEVNPELFSYARHAIDLYNKGEHPIEAWKAKELLVDRFGLASNFWRNASPDLKEEIRDPLADVVSELAHLNYVRMQEAKPKTKRKTETAEESARFYLQLSALRPDTVTSYESMYLAAEALQTGGNYKDAVHLYTEVAYSQLEHKYQADSGYAALLTSQKYEAQQSGVKPSEAWESEQLSLANRFIDAFPTHQASSTVALAVAAQYQTEGDVDKATALLASYERFAKATISQKVDAAYNLAALLYNASSSAEQLKLAEQSYRHVQALAKSDSAYKLPTTIQSSLGEGIANSLYKQAELQEDKGQRIALYKQLFEEYPSHTLAADALFNAASLSTQLELWAEAEGLHRVFHESYASHALIGTSRQQLIVALESQDRTQEAADELMLQAKAVIEENPELSANSGFQAAQYYAKNDFKAMANDSYRWVLKKHPKRTDLGIEAYGFFVENAKGKKQISKVASELLSYVDDKSLDDARSLTLAAQSGLTLASYARDSFNELKLTQPFQQSLKKKTKSLEVCSKAYKRVVEFGIAEYTNAARFEMASIYQTLAHDIMASERPNGLSALENEQYDLLLEERAIPIEEEAIALYEQNIRSRTQENQDEWILESYRALAELNPSLYERPLIGPSYAPVSY